MISYLNLYVFHIIMVRYFVVFHTSVGAYRWWTEEAREWSLGELHVCSYRLTQINPYPASRLWTSLVKWVEYHFGILAFWLLVSALSFFVSLLSATDWCISLLHYWVHQLNPATHNSFWVYWRFTFIDIRFPTPYPDKIGLSSWAHIWRY